MNISEAPLCFANDATNGTVADCMANPKVTRPETTALDIFANYWL